MLFSILLITILIGLFVKTKIRWFDCAVIILLGILMYFSANVPDFDNYNNVYNHIGKGIKYTDTGIGWLYLCRIGNRIGLNYKAFSILLVMISELLIATTVRRFLPNRTRRNYVWALYLIFPALLDLVQIRFFVAEAIFIFSVYYLLQRNIKGYTIYTLLCALAILIHTSAIIYLIFLLVPFFHQIKRYIVWITVIATVAVLAGRNQIIRIAPLFINPLRVSRYFNSVDSVGPFGAVAYLFTLLAFCHIANSGYKSIKAQQCSEDVMAYSECFYQMTVMIWIILPLTTFDTSFFRIQRPLWMLLYIMCASLSEERIYSIRVFNRYTLRSRFIGIAMAVIGLVAYICVFNFNVIQAFLL